MGIFGKLLGAVSGGAAEPLPEQAVLIDVRSQAEFDSGHIKGAILLPLDRVGRDIGSVVKDKSAPIIVYCRSGARSGVAKQQLQGLGYTQVVNGGGVGALALRMQREILR